MNRQERFSLRKYKFGVASVLLGAVLVFGSAQASAEEQAASQTSAGTQLVATTQQAPAEEEHSQATEASTAVASEKVAVAKEATVAEKTTNATEAAHVEKTEAPKEAATVPETKPEVAEKPVEKAAAVATATSSETTNRHEAAEKPQSIESDEIITVPQTWKQGYKGEGMVVAVIDSGLDVNHEVLRITDPSKAKFKNQEEIEAAKKAAGIDYGNGTTTRLSTLMTTLMGPTILKRPKEILTGCTLQGLQQGILIKKQETVKRSMV